MEAEVVDRFVYLERYVRWAAGVLGVRAPLVGRTTARDGERARYAPSSRMVLLGPLARVEDAVHEVQHHLDELCGAKAGGEQRGRHSGAFYERLATTSEVLEAAEREQSAFV